MPSMEIKTPIFKNEAVKPPKLVGTAEGWVDPGEICGITSGIHIFPQVVDVDNGNTHISGGLLTLLYFKGGNKLLVFGTPKKIRAQRLEALAEERRFKLSETRDSEPQPEAESDAT